MTGRTGTVEERRSLTEATTTALLRLAPLSATVLAILWAGAIGFRAGWWSTGRIDTGWDAMVRGIGTPAPQLAAQVLAVLGTGVPALIEVALLVLVVLLRRGAFWALAAAAICALSSLDVRAMKAVAGRLRPDSAYGWQNAFPSGHTALAAVLMTLAALLVLHGRWRLLALPYPIAMAWSRTQLHAHWLSDVLAGLLLGAATAVLLVLLAEGVRVRLLGATARRGSARSLAAGAPAASQGVASTAGGVRRSDGFAPLQRRRGVVLGLPRSPRTRVR